MASHLVQWWNPILEALRDMGGAATPREVTEWIIDKYQIPEGEYTRRYEKSGQFVFENQLRWTRNFLVYEGLVSKAEYGIWELTKKGWNAGSFSEQQIKSIQKKWSTYFAEIRKKNGKSDKDGCGQDDRLLISRETENITLLEVLKSLSPYGFEKICARLLREYGFEDVKITQRSRDGGIDGFAKLRLNPFINMSVSFQCKRYDGSVPLSDVRDFGYTVKDKEKGIFITTGYFSESARKIEQQDAKLELIDGEKLVEMFERIKLGVVEQTVYVPDISFFEPYKNEQ